MRYQALATDYDGTLAADGSVNDGVWDAIKKFRGSGRRIILVTGRELADLQEVCPHLDRFDHVVAENGGVLYQPSSREQRLLAPAIPQELVTSLRDRGVRHIEQGSTLVATVKPNETKALQAIRDLGLELKLVFNKDAVMILSPHVSKASGLRAALTELGLSTHNVVGIGDAENDHAFLELCECSFAVANALPVLKAHADFETKGEDGHGVMELIDELLADDLSSRQHQLPRHLLTLGNRIGHKDQEERFSPYGTVLLVAGSSGGGKTSATLRLLERLVEAGYQFCGFDPEGDYETFEQAVVLGGPHHPPSHDEVLQLLRDPRQNVIVNLTGIPQNERPRACAEFLVRLQELRAQTSRPHWLIFDEAHHLFPLSWDSAPIFLPQQLETGLLITVHPGQLSPAILKHVNLALAVGDNPQETLAEFARSIKQQPPSNIPTQLEKREAAIWRLGERTRKAVTIAMQRGKTEHRRHIRKYAEGLLIPERSFYFRGPEGKLNLRAHNLLLFLELADGVDDETWEHHLRNGDYSHWFGEIIGDDELGQEAREIEGNAKLSPRESRKAIRNAVECRYTTPANPALPRIEESEE